MSRLWTTLASTKTSQTWKRQSSPSTRRGQDRYTWTGVECTYIPATQAHHIGHWTEAAYASLIPRTCMHDICKLLTILVLPATHSACPSQDMQTGTKQCAATLEHHDALDSSAEVPQNYCVPHAQGSMQVV